MQNPIKNPVFKICLILTVILIAASIFSPDFTSQASAAEEKKVDTGFTNQASEVNGKRVYPPFNVTPISVSIDTNTRIISIMTERNEKQQVCCGTVRIPVEKYALTNLEVTIKTIIAGNNNASHGKRPMTRENETIGVSGYMDGEKFILRKVIARENTFELIY